MALRRKGNHQQVTCDDNNRFYPSANLSGGVVTSGGGGFTLIEQTTTTTTILKELLAGTGISLTPGPGTITIANSLPTINVSVATAGGATNWVVDGTGPIMTTRGWGGYTGIDFVGSTSSNVVIRNTPAASGGVVTVTDAPGATAHSFVQDGTGPAIGLGTINAGTGITVAGGGTANLTISSTVSSAESVTLSSAGSGGSIVADGTGPDLAVYRLSAAGNAVAPLSANNFTLGNHGFMIADAGGVQPTSDAITITGATNSIAFGSSNNITNANSTIVIGHSSVAIGAVRSTAIGVANDISNSANAVVIGNTNTNGSSSSVLIGNRSTMSADQSVALGTAGSPGTITFATHECFVRKHHTGAAIEPYFAFTPTYAVVKARKTTTGIITTNPPSLITLFPDAWYRIHGSGNDGNIYNIDAQATVNFMFNGPEPGLFAVPTGEPNITATVGGSQIPVSGTMGFMVHFTNYSSGRILINTDDSSGVVPLRGYSAQGTRLFFDEVRVKQNQTVAFLVTWAPDFGELWMVHLGWIHAST